MKLARYAVLTFVLAMPAGAQTITQPPQETPNAIDYVMGLKSLVTDAQNALENERIQKTRLQRLLNEANAKVTDLEGKLPRQTGIPNLPNHGGVPTPATEGQPPASATQPAQ